MKWLASLLLPLLFWGGGWTGLHAQSPETLTGLVVNGTPGAAVPDGVEVTLGYLDAQGEPVVLRTSVVGGTFTFSDLPTAIASAYHLEVEYGGVPYSREVPASLVSAPAPLTVYETRGDVSVFSLLDSTLIIAPGENGGQALEVLAVIQLENRSDRTFITSLEEASPMDLLRFSLPPDAYDLTVQAFLEGGHMVQVDRGFALTTPVPPGGHDLLFAYHAPYEGGRWSFEQIFPFGAGVFRVMLAEGLGRLTAPGLEKQGRVAVGAVRYQVMEARDIAPGDRLTLRLDDLPKPSLWQRLKESAAKESYQRALVLILFGGGLVTLLGMAVLRRRSGRRSGAEAAPMSSESREQKREELVRTIARLDQLRDRGAMEEERHRQSRQDLMAQLQELVMRETLHEPRSPGA